MNYCCFDGLMNAMEAIIFKIFIIFIIFKSVNFFSQEGANGWEKWIPAKGFLSLHFRFMVENFIKTLLKMLSLVSISYQLVGGLDGGYKMHCQKKYRRWIRVFNVNSDRLMLGQWKTQLLWKFFTTFLWYSVFWGKVIDLLKILKISPRGQLAHWLHLPSVKPNKLYNIKNSLSPVNIFPNKALENAVLPFQR